MSDEMTPWHLAPEKNCKSTELQETSPVLERLPMSNAALWLEYVLEKLPKPSFGAILAFRLVNALTLNTFFQADEYWQALEPAHAFVFGYGYLTWEWQLGLRSYLHPLIYMVPYWLVKCFESTVGDTYTYVLVGPKVVNALVAATGDYYLYHLMETMHPSLSSRKNFAKLVSYLSFFSAWNWYCWCRSFANSIELTMTIIALYYFKNGDYSFSLIIAAFNCIIRPTNAIIWLFYFPGVFLKFPKLIIIALLTAAAVIGLDAIVNYYFYLGFKLPLWQFFKFNVSDSLSSFYGISRVDFYFLQAIPILLLNYLPFFLYGIAITQWSESKTLCLFYLLVFTAIPHKEFRFIYPLMPFLLMYSASGITKISSKVSIRFMKVIMVLTISTSIGISYYFSQIHEQGELQIPTTLRNLILEDTNHAEYRKSSIGFLTPCHSTPFQSHFHLNDAVVDIWFLTCEPPLKKNLKPGVSIQDYQDESDYFYNDPAGFMRDNFPLDMDPSFPAIKTAQWPHQWPQYLVFFENLWDSNYEFQEMISSHYELIDNIWNAPFHWDDRRLGDLLILKYKS